MGEGEREEREVIDKVSREREEERGREEGRGEERGEER